jgi:hypothetical protein
MMMLFLIKSIKSFKLSNIILLFHNFNQEPTGDKFKMAQQNGIQIVNRQWFYDSIEKQG